MWRERKEPRGKLEALVLIPGLGAGAEGEARGMTSRCLLSRRRKGRRCKGLRSTRGGVQSRDTRVGMARGPGPHPYLVCVCRYLDRTGSLRVPQEADHTLPAERKYGMGVLKGQIRDKSQYEKMELALTKRIRA